jgi:hypothetical protein
LTPQKAPKHAQKGLPASKPPFLAVIGLGYLLVLVSSGTFLAILFFNDRPSPVEFDVARTDGMTWIELEKLYAETVLSVDHLAIKAEHRLDMVMIYNFSTLPIQVTVTNEGNLTLPDFMVQVLIEDQTGHIRGVGSAALRVSAADERVAEKVFLYNVPALLRGQELRIHVLSMIQKATIVMDKQLLLVRTFPRLEEPELPRILLFFLTFSALPVSVFLPSTVKQRAENWWRRMCESNYYTMVLLMLFFTIALAGYWDYVCKVLSFF